MKTTRILIGMMAAFVAVSGMASDPTISQVTVRQRWPWSRLVDVDYLLTCDATQRIDVVVTAHDGSTELALPPQSLIGDLYGVTHGVHRIIWDPTTTSYTNNQVLTQFNVTLAPITPPLYMIVDLTKAANDEEQITYLYEAELTSGAYGSVETNPVAGIASIIWTGVTNNSAYKDQKLVLRRIQAGSVTNLLNASISVGRDFYVSVFELTQNQWYRIKGAYPTCKFSDKNGPVETSCSYNALRGSTVEGIDWPTTGSRVGPNSLIAAIRNKTWIVGFDLPDDNQWQYACRAGTSTIYNDNNYAATTTEVNNTNTWLHVLGCYRGNAGVKTAVVGKFRPNAWGLYDMHGNVLEWTLNCRTGTNRTRRGGSYFYEAARCMSDFSNDDIASSTDSYGMNGARLVVGL